jgi:hypothetical protein
VLEAMAHGLPCVGSVHDAAAEVIVDGETGILVDPGITNEWAAMICALLEHPQRAREMGEAGRNRVLEHFTYDRFHRRITDLLGQAFDGPRGDARPEIAVLHVIPSIARGMAARVMPLLGFCRALNARGVRTAIATTNADGEDVLPVPIGAPSTYEASRRASSSGAARHSVLADAGALAARIGVAVRSHARARRVLSFEPRGRTRVP